MTFVPNPGFEDEMRRHGGVRAERLKAAQQIVRDAERHAPETTGRYRDSLRAVVDGDDVRAESTDPTAHMTEWGSLNNPAYSPIRRGVASAGYELDEDRKP